MRSRDFVSRTLEQGGASRNVHTLKPVSDSAPGYIVGIRSPGDAHEREIKPERFDTAQVRSHRSGLLADNMVRKDPDSLQGSWKDGYGNVVLDHSRHVATFHDAFALAKTHTQDAIYKPSTGEEIGVMKMQRGDLARPVMQIDGRYTRGWTKSADNGLATNTARTSDNLRSSQLTPPGFQMLRRTPREGP
jgi:hypothetical protein